MSEYIERGALMEKSKGYHVVAEPPVIERVEYAVPLYDVATAPAADVEPVVHGVWVEMHDPYGDLTGWIHEECGRETTSADEYCSKCGAKMTFVERSDE